jgi:hypothetical protein
MCAGLSQPELSDADLIVAFSARFGPDIPPELADALINVIEALEQKLDRIEQSVRAA